ncbi:MAG: hypothetical protein K5912_03150 [Alphaproteobacteria bacterium]|nr:hypothetical protein [Alphaproteobacteria bacterium]
MSKQKTSVYFIGALAAIVAACIFIEHRFSHSTADNSEPEITSKYGSYLAAQHAIYVNDFEAAAKFAKDFEDVEYASVKNTRILTDFLSGKMPENIELLDKEKSATSRLIYDANLVCNNDWDALYKRHSKNTSAFFAPLRIWAAIGKNRKTETLKYIDTLKTNSSWKAFIRGQIFVETGDIQRAAEEFANVKPEFMNLMDYLYLMSFYQEFEYFEDADILRQDFTSTPGGMFMANYKDIPKWSTFGGIKNALAFDLIQNVSHTQVMLYSDMSLLLLRFSEVIGNKDPVFTDAINYYSGQFLFNTNGNYRAAFNKISENSPFYLFGMMRSTEKTNDMRTLSKILDKEPLFIPAMERAIAVYIQTGKKKSALNVINNAFKNENLSALGRAYLMKRRAYIYTAFGDSDSAQKDIDKTIELAGRDAETLILQARIWAVQNQELDDAYDYAMALIRKNPTDVFAWDTVGMIVLLREGIEPAFDIYAQVGKTANSCSSLFEHLGDIYVKKGEKQKARDAYLRAIDLSSDGLVIVPNIEKKIRNLK